VLSGVTVTSLIDRVGGGKPQSPALMSTVAFASQSRQLHVQRREVGFPQWIAGQLNLPQDVRARRE
jgi:hypothetical protein